MAEVGPPVYSVEMLMKVTIPSFQGNTESNPEIQSDI